MNRVSLRRLLLYLPLKTGSVAFLLFALLFAGGSWQSSPGSIASVLRETTAILRDPETQWMVFLCLAIYFTAFLFLRSRSEKGLTQRRKGAKAIHWLAGLLFINAVLYALHYSPSTPALTLLAGAVIGQGFAVGANFKGGRLKAEGGNDFSVLVVSLVVILLALAATWQTDSGHSFAYRSHARWSGPWDNPNIFGLLMGTGFALAVGLFVQSLKSKVQGREIGARSWKLGVGKYTVVILCLLAAIFMARGLLHSYSRGAWIATLCGLVYFFWAKVQSLKFKVQGHWISRLAKSWFPLSVILVSAFVLMFWHFRQTDWHPARRALSAVNTVDFSWRNRVAAWEGILQITAEHPWFGAGWNQPEPLYEHYYLPPNLNESAAIEMNDYLMLAATLGIPALFCFGMYLWLSLAGKAKSRKQKAEITDRQDAGATLADSLSAPGGRGEGQGEVRAIQSAEIRSQDLKLDLRPPASDLLSITCRAGAIVLLVGFWFDGGLLKLPTAATFWFLLELGSVTLHKGAANQTNEVS